ncbi:hypothetical protein FQA47_024039 [Oryzias melastigma]|uniref:Uncharacterized protein n=1 Tax=Oryzias melastigma TaxID=30732 RepID=A0A834BN42_ORYME|nr:hypothetical protein FQA47_024039 [Oryzias melastigma]
MRSRVLVSSIRTREEADPERDKMVHVNTTKASFKPRFEEEKINDGSTFVHTERPRDVSSLQLSRAVTGFLA